MDFGVYLPTYAWPDLTPERAGRLAVFARSAERLGFDALWVGEHFLVAGHYGTAWMSPLLCLAHAAAVTTRIRLATGVLVLPYHHPLALARHVQTLHHLAGGRLVLGVGPGWDRAEFEALGLDLSERGGRTDEILAALRRLLTEPTVTFEGRFYRFRDASILPLPARPPELWVAGGSKIPLAGSPDPPRLAPRVLERICAADGWLARGDATPAMLAADLAAIRAHMARSGRDPGALRYGHYNFAHLVDAPDREAALRRQRPLFERAMGPGRPFAEVAACHLLGTTEDVVERLAALEAAGFDYFVLATLTDDVEQLERFAAEVIPRLRPR